MLKNIPDTLNVNGLIERLISCMKMSCSPKTMQNSILMFHVSPLHDKIYYQDKEISNQRQVSTLMLSPAFFKSFSTGMRAWERWGTVHASKIFTLSSHEKTIMFSDNKSQSVLNAQGQWRALLILSHQLPHHATLVEMVIFWKKQLGTYLSVRTWLGWLTVK